MPAEAPTDKPPPPEAGATCGVVDGSVVSRDDGAPVAPAASAVARVACGGDPEAEVLVLVLVPVLVEVLLLVVVLVRVLVVLGASEMLKTLDAESVKFAPSAQRAMLNKGDTLRSLVVPTIHVNSVAST
jgi:hypothetical protein